MPRAEDKNKNFKKLANIRVNRALDAMRLIGNLSNKQNYEYSDYEAQTIVNALEGEIREIKSKFIAHKKKNTKKKFSL